MLVHCMMGISRSASTVIAYLMWKERIGFVAAAQRVYAARPFISPNPGFVLQLRLWEKMGMDFAGWQGWSRTKCVRWLLGRGQGRGQGVVWAHIQSADGIRAS